MGSHSNTSSITSSEENSSSESSKARLLRSRSQSEKKRRDRLNSFIQELQLMLAPKANKRLDKLTVLKMTVNFLSKQNDISINVTGSVKNTNSFFIPFDELGQLMFEAINGFIIVINDDGKLLYIADVIEKILGIKASTYMGKPIHSLVHEEDRIKVTEEIMTSTYFLPGSETSSYMELLDDTVDKNVVKLDFRAKVKSEVSEDSYRKLSCIGKWQKIKTLEESGYVNRVLLLLASINTDMREIAPPKDSPTGFTSKQGLDLTFVFVDQNCPSITGYTAYELLGKSLYLFAHIEDLPEITVAHEQLTKNRLKEAKLFFRFCSKGEEWLLLNLNMQLKNNEGAMQPDFIHMAFNLASHEEIQNFRKTSLDKAKTTKALVFQNLDTAKKNPKKEPAVEMIPEPDPPEQSINENINENECVVEVDTIKDGTEWEQTLEIQKILHNQLTEKHKYLSESFEKQEAQLERIFKIMVEYKSRMEEPAFKDHFSEQLEMYDYFKYLLKKHKRHQDYLVKQVRSKIKDLELRERAVKLRNMVSHQQKILKDIRVRRKNDYDTGENENESECVVEIPKSNNSSGNVPEASANFDTSAESSSVRNNENLFPGVQCVDVLQKQPYFDAQEQQTLGTYPPLNYLSHDAQQQVEEAMKQQNQQIAQQQQQNRRDAQRCASVQNQLSTSESLEKSVELFQQTNDTNDLQKVISKQILVHLQVLQKNVLTQLVNVMQNKPQNNADFGQVLPVLQQLQQLQQSILSQQSLQVNTDGNDSGNVDDGSKTEQDLMTLLTSLPQSLARENTVVQSSNAQQSQPPQLTLGSNLPVSQRDLPELDSQDRIFGQEALKELDGIKEAFAYDESKSKNDCFPNVSSPEFRALLFDSNLTTEDNNDKTEDENLKKDAKKLEEEEKQNYSQPFLENQQHLLQLQQYQRMHIFMQQRQQLQLVQSNSEQQRRQQPQSQQPSQQSQPQQQGEQQQVVEQQQNLQQQQNPTANQGFDGIDSNIAEFINANLENSWLNGENEEVLNMLLSETDYLWYS